MRTVLFVNVLCLLLSTPSLALFGDRYQAFGVDASLRTISGASVNYDSPMFSDRSDGFSQTLLRLELGGYPLDWLQYEVHLVEDLNMNTFGSNLTGVMGFMADSGARSTYRIRDLNWNWGQEKHVQAKMWIDRLYFKVKAPWFDLVVGRQAITFGKAHFWNPLDVFLAFDPTQFDRDYKAGVDAVRLNIPLGEFSGITLVGVLGRDDNHGESGDDAQDVSWYGSAVLARIFTNLWNWDLALQTGKVFGGYQIGGAASGELFDIEIRAEGAYHKALDEDPLGSHFIGVVGLGYRFDFDLLVECEYLYNGVADPDNMLTSFQYVMDARSYHVSRHVVGAMVSYQILPILSGSLVWIFSLSDQSSLLQPGLVYSLSDEADFLFGAMFGLGARPRFTPEFHLESEFGTYPNFYYMEFKFYF